ncbi:unannotated protein [freshwater metagenome]|uniref:Unannotated protein n=1 Tax=freshwater metagenome TaxID=449393 RepID=A0A6J7EVP2_9ZZZZ|nr:cyclic nucleotide-binding domain-containing protein [Actinomycetota bacterium]
MVHRETPLERLGKVPLLRVCSKRELETIARLTTTHFAEAGATLLVEGTFAREMMIVVEGTASVHRHGVKVAEIGPGDVIGELGLLTGHPRNASVVADTKMELLVLGSAEFSTLLDDVPSVTRKVLNTLAMRLAEAEQPTA